VAAILESKAKKKVVDKEIILNKALSSVNSNGEQEIDS